MPHTIDIPFTLSVLLNGFLIILLYVEEIERAGVIRRMNRLEQDYLEERRKNYATAKSEESYWQEYL